MSLIQSASLSSESVSSCFSHQQLSSKTWIQAVPVYRKKSFGNESARFNLVGNETVEKEETRRFFLSSFLVCFSLYLCEITGLHTDCLADFLADCSECGTSKDAALSLSLEPHKPMKREAVDSK